MLAQLKEHGNDPLTPIVVQRGLKQDQINYLYEHGREFPGVRMQDSFLRSYPYRSLAAQVLGYVGQISPEEYKRLKRQGYQPTDSIGQAGVESTYDTYLRGKDGKAQLTVDSRGRPKGAARLEAEPTPGQALRLTIDIKLQRAAERALKYGVDLARASGIEGRARRRRRDRRAQPEGRRGARDGVVPDLPAVDLRRPQGSEEARAAARSGRGREGEPPRHQPRDRRRVSARARRSSR